jgi:hypothetical protein
MLLAQVNTATIVGTITDPSGAAVPGAVVVATNSGTLAEKTTRTDATGSYVLERLPVGDYTLSVTLDGFKQAERRDIQLDATQRVKIDVALEVGTVSESVTVVGGAPLVATQNTELGVVIAEEQVRNLPLNGRNFSQLIALEPGAVVSGGAVYFNGLTRDGVNITVDGTDATNPDRPGTANFGGQSQQNILSVEFIEEFKTTKGIFSAELGRAVSGGVNVITKSGTNELHGSVFEFLRNDVFDARNFFAAKTDHLRLNQFGATAGGPMVRNRAFFFAGWERVRERRAQQVSGTVPTDLLREQMIAANPEYERLLSLVPLSNEDRGDPYRGFHRRSAGRPTDEDSFLGRLDFNVSSNDNLFVRYSILDSYTLAPSLSPINGREYPSQDRSGTLSWNRILSPAAINEVRIGVSKQDIPRADQAFQHQQIGSLAGYISTPGQEVLQANGGSYTILDNVAYTTGRHSLKAGFEMRRFHYGRANFENPDYDMETREDLLASQFTEVRVTIGNDLRRLNETQWGFYVQDDFRLNPRLTLNLGLRYEYFSPVKERDGYLFNVVSDPFGPFRQQGDAIWEADRNNFGPRFGFAWDIGGDSKNVIRGGAGVFYSPNTYREVTALVNPPDSPYTLQLSAAEFPDLRYPIDALNLDPSEFEAPLLRTIFDPFQRTSYSSQWSLDYQREIGHDLVATAGYVGNHGVKLLALHWLNDLDPVTRVRPNPNVGRISYQEHSGMSTYHGLQMSLRKRFSQGFMFNGHYTWGKAIERGGVDNMTASGTSTVQDHLDIRGSRGRTPTDINHILSLDYSWDLPFLSWFKADSGPARAILGGWQFLGIVSMRTGTPVLVTSGRDNFGLGSSTGQRPDLVAGESVTLEGYQESNTHTFLNRAAFVDPCDARSLRRPCGVFGNFGRHVVSGPGLANFDMSLFKNTQLTERMTLQFRTEFFNIFNHTNFNNPNGTLTSGTFGQITSSGAAREVQFALKLLF